MDADARARDGGDCAEAPVDITAEEQAWDEAMHQALNIARAEGKVPGQVEETIQGAHASTLDWRTLLRRYMTDTAKRDYTWSQPNRRFIDSGLYLPAMHSEAMGTIVVLLDTSGSIYSYDPQYGGDRGGIIRAKAGPTTWRGIDDRSGRAFAGVGIGLVSECLRGPSHGGPQRGDEERAKPNGNNDLDVVDRGRRAGLITNIANSCLYRGRHSTLLPKVWSRNSVAPCYACRHEHLVCK